MTADGPLKLDYSSVIKLYPTLGYPGTAPWALLASGRLSVPQGIGSLSSLACSYTPREVAGVFSGPFAGVV
jgi:hypothetical protein